MEIRPINKSEIVQWKQYVDENPTIAWQTYYWSEVVKRHYDVGFLPVAAFHGNQISGIMPLYTVPTIKRKLDIISVPYAVGGGISADNPAVEKALIDCAIALHDEKQANRIVFKQYKHKLDGPFTTDDNFYNRELDLTVGPERLYRQLDDKNKLNIERSATGRIRLIYPSYDINSFYRLLLRHHRNSGIPCVSKKWIKDLVGFKMYSMAILTLDDNLVAGTMVKEHKKTVSFPFTAIPDVDRRSEMFAYRLYWELIKKFSNEGKEIFHSGRIPNNDMTYAYRLGWNGTKHGYFYQFYPGGDVPSPSRSRKSRKRQVVSALWKRLPIDITAFLGPKIVKYFP